MRTQTTEVYEKLKHAIIDGVYKPSESLTELELANQYGASRNTVKKALLMLEKENMVTIEQNKSAKVRTFSRDDVLELLEVRGLLEGFVARLTIPVMTAEQINAMDALLQKMQRHREENDLLSYPQSNHEFHTVMYEACPNQTAVAMILSIKNQLRNYNLKTIFIPGRNDQSMSEHKAIMDAVKSRDAELGDVLMCRHIANLRTTIKENAVLLF